MKCWTISGCLLVAGMLSACATPAPQGPEPDLRAYHEVLVEPFTLEADLPVQDPQALAEQFRDAFTAEFRDAAMLADAPGPGVLRVEIEITGVNRSNAVVNALTAALLFLPLDAGGASIVMELHDAQTGRLVHRRELRSTSTPLAIKGSFSAYGHANTAFGRWGRDLRQTLLQQRIG